MRLLFLDTFKRKKEPLTLFVVFLAFLFAFTCAYSLFDAIKEADFLSGKKYEATDIGDLYTEKQSSPDSALLSPTLFSPLVEIIFGFLLSSSTPDIIFTAIVSVRRC